MSAALSRAEAVAGIASIPLAGIALAALEAALLAADAGNPGGWDWWAALGVTLPWTLELAAPVWIFAAAMAGAHLALAALPGSEITRRRAVLAATTLAGAALAVWIHSRLGTYAPFRWYPPLLGLTAAFAAVVVLGHARAFSDRWPRLAGALWPVAGLVGFAAVHLASHSLFVGRYPALHLAALLWAAALLHLACFSLLRVLLRRGRTRPVAASVVAVLVLAAPALFAPRELAAGLTEEAAASDALGQAWLVGRSYDPRTEDALAGPLPFETDAAAAALFDAASRFPPLPGDFRLEDHNVLLVTSEATRWDQTSLARPELRTTPNLAALVSEGGATSFDEAYAASSGTLHSLSALLCMGLPSMLRIETWRKAWHGRLHEDEETVPDLFARAGYDTFLVSHDYNGAFEAKKTMSGLDAGFASVDYVYEDGEEPGSETTDARLADLAVARLRERAGGDRRFFGWIFFASPHFDYFAHYADMPGETDLDRYRQELRFMDENLGRVLDALRETGLLERTVIAFAGDHGEEFGEHGGEYHKTTVYSESVRVPLVVRVPGMHGGRIDGPTSVAYLFPWLAQAGPSPLAEEIGPMMRATGGAVVVELVGHDRMLSSLVLPSRKINYDFLSGRVELFDRTADPLEQRDLLDDRPELEHEAREVVDAYRKVRAARRRYSLDPEKER
jgi:arylsulfatase A-like enzyme